MKILLVSVCLFASILTCYSQTDEELKKPVDDLFKAFITRDSALARNTMVPNAILFSLNANQGQSHMKNTGIKSFLDFIGNTERPEISEPVWNYKILRDGELGFVWVDYAFYNKGKLSHCGVDAFQLVNDGGNWKIFSIVDTRRKENCDIPKKIRNQYEY